jgi:transcriptional regulator with XRE-family HTH domain
MHDMHHMPNWSGVSDTLRAARSRAYLSQGEVAARAGVTKQAVSLIERIPERNRAGGRPYRPRRQTLIKVATAVEVDPDVVLGAAGYAPLSTPERGETRGGVSVSRRRVAEKLDQLPDHVVVALEQLVDTLLDVPTGNGARRTAATTRRTVTASSTPLPARSDPTGRHRVNAVNAPA